MITISIILLVLGGIGKAIRDTLAHHFEKSIFKNLNPYFWNPVLSCNNKWKGGNKINGEKFFQSSNLLVALTEGWHVGEFINVNFLISGTLLIVLKLNLIYGLNLGFIYGLIVSRVTYGVSFFIFYKFILIKNKK